MNGLPRVFVPLATSCFFGALALAESATGVATDRARVVESVSNPIIKPAEPKPAVPRRERAISDTVAARLAESLPKLPPPTPTEIATDAPASAVEEASSPVLVLPRYFVREDRVTLDDRQVLTREGRRALALKHHPGLFLSEGRLFFSWAEVMAQDELAAARAKEISDLSSLLPSNSRQTRQLKESLPTRSNAWVDMGGSFQHRNDDRKP